MAGVDDVVDILVGPVPRRDLMTPRQASTAFQKMRESRENLPCLSLFDWSKLPQVGPSLPVRVSYLLALHFYRSDTLFDMEFLIIQREFINNIILLHDLTIELRHRIAPIFNTISQDPKSRNSIILECSSLFSIIPLT